jgi:hypothetical protein
MPPVERPRRANVVTVGRWPATLSEEPIYDPTWGRLLATYEERWLLL